MPLFIKIVADANTGNKLERCTISPQNVELLIRHPSVRKPRVVAPHVHELLSELHCCELCCFIVSHVIQKANIWQRSVTASSSKCRRYSITRWMSCSSERCARYDYVRLRRRRPAVAQRHSGCRRRRTTSSPISNTSISNCRRRPTTRPPARRHHCSGSAVCSAPPWSYSANCSSDRWSGRRHAMTCSSRDVIAILHVRTLNVRRMDGNDRRRTEEARRNHSHLGQVAPPCGRSPNAIRAV